MLSTRVCLRSSFIIIITALRYNAFNIDTKAPIIKTTGQLNSYFGFSVAQHQMKNTNTGIVNHVLIVGAPKGNNTDGSSSAAIRKIVEPGVVYQCPFDSQLNNCAVIIVDSDEFPGSNVDRNNQWMGVSVSSQGTEEGSAMVCAHRSKRFGRGYVYGQGLCVSLTNQLTEDQIWDPCTGKRIDDFHYELCQAGISASVSKTGEFLIGAPGVVKWRGTVFRNSELDVTWSQAAAEEAIRPGDPQPAMPGLDSYLGFSVKIGRVIGGRVTYVAGAPRALEIGQVLLFQRGDDQSKFLSIQKEHYLTGDQFGSQFGYDIAMADFNGDGKEDLVVGAPFYHGSGIGGAIYIFLNGPEGVTTYTKPLKIVSRKMTDNECTQLNCQNARFGISIANIGDIDQDGFDDLAVGAPYEGRGAVYIFRGSSAGLVKDYSQRIVASELPSVQPRAFGYSIVGGQDMDRNGYPDIVVGSFESGHVHILRSRPVVNLITDFVAIPNMINPKETKCNSSICFELQICVRFTAYPKSRFTKPIRIQYTLMASKLSDSKIPRVLFGQPGSDHSSLIKTIDVYEQTTPGDKICEKHLAYISSKDFLNPIALQLRYQIPDDRSPSMKPGDRVPDLDPFAILNTAHARVGLLVDFIKYCGADSRCESSLVLEAKMSIVKNPDNNYVLKVGEDQVVWMYITVQNSGEDAHQATVFITMPDSLSFLGTDEEGKRYSCAPTDDGVECSIGNPLKEGTSATFALVFDLSKATSSRDKLNISVVVNTTSVELNSVDNSAVMYLQIIVESDLLVKGASNPESVYYGGDVRDISAIHFIDEIGPSVVHNYEVKNIGRASVSQSTVYFSWPYEYLENKPLLYILEQPKLDGNGVCDFGHIIFNPRNIVPRYQPVSRNDTADIITDASPIRALDKTSSKKQEINCDTTSVKCYQFRCVLGELRPGTSFVIAIRARLWNSTFNEYFRDFDEVMIYSRAEVKIDSELNIVQPPTDNDINEAGTKANNALTAKELARISTWIIILAVFGGVLLLIIIVVVLWKVGFFQRKEHDQLLQHKATMESSSEENIEGGD